MFYNYPPIFPKKGVTLSNKYYEGWPQEKLLKNLLDELLEKEEDKEKTAGLKVRIGTLFEDRKKYDPALIYHEEALDIFRELGDKNGISKSLNSIRNICHLQSDYDLRLKYHEKALEVFKELGDKSEISENLYKIAKLYEIKKDYEQAMTYFQKSLKIYEEMDNRTRIALALHQMGIIHEKNKDYEQAITCLQRCVETYNKDAHTDRKIESLMASEIGMIGRINLELKKYSTALDNYIQVYVIRKKLKSPEIEDTKRKIQKIKPFLDEEYFYKKLRQAYIDPEKIPKAEPKGKAFPFEEFIKIALREGGEGKKNFMKSINALLNSNEVERTNPILVFLQFLAELAATNDPYDFLDKADPKMIETMSKYVPEYMEKL
ncbi:MAG: tetratricopeptide repeat protein [bacterium]|nr:tetratricopeptide repeat protein [bacterium]